MEVIEEVMPSAPSGHSGPERIVKAKMGIREQYYPEVGVNHVTGSTDLRGSDRTRHLVIQLSAHPFGHRSADGQLYPGRFCLEERFS